MFQQRGLEVHDVVDGSAESDLLGHHFSGKSGALRPTQSRFWKVHQSLLYVERGGLIGPREFERLLGHVIFVLMLRRPLLSILHHSYRFAQCVHGRVVPWRSVMREFGLVRSLLVFAFSDLDSTVQPTVVASDSCPKWLLCCPCFSQAESD